MKPNTKRILLVSVLTVLGLLLGSVAESIRITEDIVKGLEGGLGATLLTPLNVLLIFGYMPVTHLLFLIGGLIAWILSVFYFRKGNAINLIAIFSSAASLGIPNSYLFWAMISV